MSFLNLSPCCLKGSTLSGTPRGEVQVAGTPGVSVDRYFVKPKEVVDDKTALVIFYDIFGFSIPNPKIIADTFADRLGLDTYVPDYLSKNFPASYLEPSVKHYPSEKAGQGVFGRVWDKLRLLPILPYLPGVLDGHAGPLVDKAMADLKAQGYTRIVSVGYCRGGSMETYLLAKGDECPLTAAVIMHPAWEPDRFAKFTKPSLWLLAEEDDYISPQRRTELEEAFKKNARAEFSSKLFPGTVHGFGARPAAEDPGMQAAFNEANDDAVAWLKKQLGL